MNLFRPKNANLAVGALVVSASMWGLIWYPLRLLDDAGLPGLWSSLVMYLAAAVLTLPMLISRRRGDFQHSFLLLSLAVAAGITNVAFVVAMIQGEIVRVMLLFYLSPLWTVLLGRWWLAERLSFKAKLYFSLAMIGAVIMLWDPQIARPWPRNQADWLALIAGIAFATHNVLARKLSEVSMQTKVTVIWWGVVLIAVVAILLEQAELPSTELEVWLGACLLGWLGIVVMTVATLYGIARMPVYRSSVIMLFELLVAAVAAWWLTEEIMAPSEWVGGLLIVVAAYGVAMLGAEDKSKRGNKDD